MYFSPEYMENLQRAKDCMHFKHIDRVLHLSNFYSWKILDSELNCTLSEAMMNPALLDQIQWEFHNRYHFDAHMDFCTRNFLMPSKILGSSHVKVNDEAGTINFYDHVIMEGTEYGEFVNDNDAFCWKMFNRKHPGMTKDQILRAMVENMEFGRFTRYMAQKSVEQYNVPGVYSTDLAAIVAPPMEKFYKYYRGIRGFSMDMRRRQGELIDISNRIHEEQMMPALRKSLAADSQHFICDTFTGLLAHASLSIKQWDALYWPYLKEYIDTTIAAGKTMVFYVEDSIMRFAEYFQDYPKGSLLFILELDDLAEVRKKLPNVCLAGGMTSDLLGMGTPEQCIDQVKKLCDQLGDGFILSQNKMISFKNDCQRENLKAVCDYVRDFRW